MSTQSVVKLKPSPKCACCDLENELMIHNLDSSSVHVLNGTARYIWMAYSKNPNLEEIAKELADSFEALDIQTAIEDVKDTLAAFAELKLLVPSDDE